MDKQALRHALPQHAGRLLALVVLALVHGLVLLQLFTPHATQRAANSGGLQVRFIDAPPPPTRPPSAVAPRPELPKPRPRATDTAITLPQAEQQLPAPVIDWRAEAQRAAAGLADETAPRKSFGSTPDTPPAPEPKEFGWDKTHTQRVEALPEGGTLIRLSDNCVLVLAPFPIPACGLGKRKARGDLFDGMKQPARPGDWKDAEGVP